MLAFAVTHPVSLTAPSNPCRAPLRQQRGDVLCLGYLLDISLQISAYAFSDHVSNISCMSLGIYLIAGSDVQPHGEEPAPFIHFVQFQFSPHLQSFTMSQLSQTNIPGSTACYRMRSPRWCIKLSSALSCNRCGRYIQHLLFQ